MSPALLTFLTFGTLFIAVLIMVQLESSYGRRFLLSQVRGWLDTKIVLIGRSGTRVWNHFVRYVVQLGWYYSIHSLLSTMLRILVSIYTYIEDHFERNRTRTKQLRSEKRKLGSQSHLSKIAQHKVDTTLSVEAQKQLKKEKLELDH